MGVHPVSDHSQVLADVVVVVGDEEEPLRRIVVLERADEEGLLVAAVVLHEVEGGHVEEGVEDGVADVELDHPHLGQHALHLRFEIGPVSAAEVVEDDEAPLQQVRAEVRRFLVGLRPVAGLCHVRHGELHEIGRPDVENRAADGPGVGRDGRNLVEDLHEVALRARVVVGPRRPLSPAEAAAPEPAAAQLVRGDALRVAEPGEHEPPVVRELARLEVGRLSTIALEAHERRKLAPASPAGRHGLRALLRGRKLDRGQADRALRLRGRLPARHGAGRNGEGHARSERDGEGDPHLFTFSLIAALVRARSTSSRSSSPA